MLCEPRVVLEDAPQVALHLGGQSMASLDVGHAVSSSPSMCEAQAQGRKRPPPPGERCPLAALQPYTSRALLPVSS
jgi:hypothetical protein